MTFGVCVWVLTVCVSLNVIIQCAIIKRRILEDDSQLVRHYKRKKMENVYYLMKHFNMQR